MRMFYVFDTEQTAVDAELYIRQVGKMPIVGINAATGEPQPTKAKTERWAMPRQRMDGKWVFEKIPDSILASVPNEVKQYYNNTFPHTIETASPEWWLIIDDI